MNVETKNRVKRALGLKSIVSSHVLLIGFATVASSTPSAYAQTLSETTQSAMNTPTSLIAQVIPPQDLQPPAAPPSPTPIPTPQPPPVIELKPPPVSPGGELVPGTVPGTIVVRRFEVTGSTIFSAADFDRVTAPFTNRPITFEELLQAQAAVTKLYTDRGYLTSGAVTPPQTVEGDVIVMQVIEGELEGITVTGTRRLHANYVRSRLQLAAQKPLNTRKLLEALQLLQLSPLIQDLSAELSSGSRPGTNFLDVRVTEARTFSAQIELDNNRSPAVGTFRRGARVGEANLLGLGDSLQVGYSNTSGSNIIDLNYTFPLNPRNGTLSFEFQNSFYRVIEDPFEPLDLKADLRVLSLSYRQPIMETPTRLVALGLTAYRRDSQTSILGVPFRLTPGADERGNTRISALRFFQEWVERGPEVVFAARSEFSFGIGAFNATINNSPPDSRFAAWRGQLQWVRLLAPDTLLVLRSDVQFANQALAPFDQFSLGGVNSVRGYRQDFTLADNGAFGSVELHLPVFRLPQARGILQVVPFVDVGRVWSSSGRPSPDPSTLAAIGLGIRWQQGDLLTFRLDWGIPLISVNSDRATLQEKGLTFSLVYNLF